MRLLIVEDEVELAETVRRALGRAGWAVDLAADAAEAEEKVGLYAYDAVVLDLNLPDLDGVELCRRLRVGGLRSRSSCSRPATGFQTESSASMPGPTTTSSSPST